MGIAMKTHLLFLSLIAAVSLHAAPKVDQPAPAFTLKDTAGKEVSLADYKGKFVVLEWINYGCPFVQKHYVSKNLPGLQKEFTEKGVVWLAICSSAPGKQGNLSAADIEKLSKQYGANFSAYLIDENGAVGREYDAKTTPEMYVINPEGVLIYKGAIDDKPTAKVDDVQGASNYVQNALNAALAGQPIPTKETKSYGCSVKY